MARSSAASAAPRPADGELRRVPAARRGRRPARGGQRRRDGGGRCARAPARRRCRAARPVRPHRLGRRARAVHRPRDAGRRHRARARAGSAGCARSCSRNCATRGPGSPRRSRARWGTPSGSRGTVAGTQADVHVFEDALLVMTGGAAKRIAFSFVADVRAQDYTVTIDVAALGPLAITRLGRRTDEFAALLAERVTRGADQDLRLPRLAAARPRPDGAARRRRAAARWRGGRGPRARRGPPRPVGHAAARRDAARAARGAVRPRGPGGPGDRLQAGDLRPPGGRRRHSLARPVRDAAHRRARDTRAGSSAPASAA